MADLSTTKTQKSYFGNLKVTYGEWTATEGDAGATMTLEGGKVWAALFTSQDSSGTMQMAPCRVSVSGTAGIITLTVYAIGETVTAGKFLVIHS